MLQVSNEDIAYAEQILFGKTGIFDQERINFIKENQTCDLQAVPGSGKTTVLLAKLLILERHLPFPDGRGVLVISHTNAAMDEIKKEIEIYCPKLFSAPHFIGTIQSFVDRFLAIPYYAQKYGRKPIRIDDDIYAETSGNFSYTHLKGFNIDESNNAKRYLRGNDICKRYRIENRNGVEILTKEFLGNILTVKKPKGNTKPANYKDWTDPEKARVYDWLMAYKKKLLESGTLCFDDAYYLAEEYLRNYPTIIKTLQNRFKYVYVDEVQDMSRNQHELLDRIFWSQGSSNAIYQRIGDKNQAIYEHDVTENDSWAFRQNVLTLSGSLRLSKRIAEIVQSLALHAITVDGRGDTISGAQIDIPPHLYVYTDASKHLVIEQFAKTIKELKDVGKIPAIPKYPYKAICWNTKQEAGKIRINDFHPPFSKDYKKPKVTFSVLESYLDRNKLPGNSFRPIKKNILNGILRVLLLESVVDEEGRIYTKSSLLKFLQDKHPDTFKILNTQLLVWCKGIFNAEAKEVLKSMQQFISDLLQLFNKKVNQSNNFLNDSLPAVFSLGASPILDNVNMTNYFGIPIEVATVHSTKGQTHTATLYMESFYERALGGGNYESERLASQIKGSQLAAGAHKFVVHSTKMAYVGFSRPTHLLGFAVHKDRFDSRLSDINQEIWKIIHL